MDPNYFSIDTSRLMEVLLTIIVLSFFLERALAPLFESRFFIKRFSQKSVKELIAVLLGFVICWIWKFDAFSFIIPLEKTTIAGYALSGAIIAGGSKASIKLFHNLLKVRSTVLTEREEENTARKKQEASTQSQPITK